MTTKTDEVNHPPHYNMRKMEAIEIIMNSLTPEEFKGYLKGNCLKYLLRCEYKGGLMDINKMLWYVQCLTELMGSGEGANDGSDT